MFNIKGEKQSQVEIKKSKFLGFVFCVDSIEAAKSHLDKLKKDYKDARHVVYAYRLEESGVLREKFDNNKEPGGSAGQPLLYLLQKKDIINCLIVVVRYFGGTKLGVGGLMRAYTKAGQGTLLDNLKENGGEEHKN
ncbi:YigZ family protein [Candidatus Parcubacteria bacterium]|jgi:uncharacterized YigZ family protein|nr:YigZ family protein [Candidatus Parcubacteria bacterium]